MGKRRNKKNLNNTIQPAITSGSAGKTIADGIGYFHVGENGVDISRLSEQQKRVLLGLEGIIPDSGQKMIIFDLETTGVNIGGEINGERIKGDRILQYGFVKYENGKITQETAHYLDDGLGNLDITKESSKVHGITPEKIKGDKNTIAFKEGLDALVKQLNAAHDAGYVISGYNINKFDIKMLRQNAKEAGVTSLKELRTFDLIDIAPAISEGVARKQGQSSKEYISALKRIIHSSKGKSNRKAVMKLGHIFHALTGKSLIGAHDALKDVIGVLKIIQHLHGAIGTIRTTQKQSAEEAALKILTKFKEDFKDYTSKSSKAHKGVGFWGGVAGAVLTYELLGRNPLNESMERYGGPKDNPYLDLGIATGSALFLHYTLRNQGAFPKLKEMFNRNLFPHGGNSHPAVGSRLKFFSYGGAGLLGYGAMALVHNAIDNRDGEGWRYPLLSFGVGGAALYASSFINKYARRMNNLGGLTDSEISTKVVHKVSRVVALKSKIALNDFKQSGFAKSIIGTTEKIKNGSLFSSGSSLDDPINSMLKHTASSTLSKVLIGGGLIMGAISLVTNQDNGTGHAVASSAISAVSNSYSKRLSSDATSYRPLRRYNQSYRGKGYSNSQPSGLGLV
jgi:DNA polymerase III epsilon subunit-like protein